MPRKETWWLRGNYFLWPSAEENQEQILIDEDYDTLAFLGFYKKSNIDNDHLDWLRASRRYSLRGVG